MVILLCAWILIRFLAPVRSCDQSTTFGFFLVSVVYTWHLPTGCIKFILQRCYCLYNCRHLPLLQLPLCYSFRVHQCLYFIFVFHLSLFIYFSLVLAPLAFFHLFHIALENLLFSSCLNVLFSGVSRVVLMCFIRSWRSFALKA